MKKYDYLIVGDIHIDENSIFELETTFEEILTYEAKTIVFLGDIFHKNHPTPAELLFAFKQFKKISFKYKNVDILWGNHDMFKGMLVTELLKNINLNIRVYKNIMHAYYNSLSSIYIGHHFVTESSDNYSRKTESIKKISAQYEYVLLGHQHRFQKLNENSWHLGSIRYVGYGEYNDPLIPKKIALINNNEIKFKDLKNPYKLLQFNNYNELVKYINETKGKNKIIENKIRIRYTDFTEYKKDINKLEKLSVVLKDKIKLKLDFQKNNIIQKNSQHKVKKTIDKKNIIKKWLKSIKDKDVQNILEKESSILCD